MKKRKIKIKQDKCTGCGKCVTPCKKGGIQIIDGKAKLVKQFYCGSFIECIGTCPQGAIIIQEQNETVDKSVQNGGCYFSGRYDIKHWIKSFKL